MRYLIPLYCLVALIGGLYFNPVSHAQGPQEWDCSELTLKADSIEGCDRAAENLFQDPRFIQECGGENTLGLMQIAALTTSCKKDVMNQKLDVRLLAIKKSAPIRFKSEMALQKSYLNGVSKHCDAFYAACQGSFWIPSREACDGEFYGIRADQADQINQGKLSLPPVTSDFKTNQKLIPSELKNYAVRLCQMPVSVWKDGKKPADCVDRALSNLGIRTNEDCSEE